MPTFNLETEYITLGQLLKSIGIISTGGEAKYFLCNNKVYVDDMLETSRNKKIYPNQKVKFNKETYFIKASDE
ncbi:MAG: RNA-binding S4 domain-containing protein [Acholeplasmatales bacterium]|jgi:S4 domain protein YaaA|nr:RNA-binding S4 domain-containing protein [Acholeplasmatales bacterium]